MTITLILPYYRQPLMLARQAEAWAGYPLELPVIVVDDGSPEPAALPAGSRAALYRIGIDLPWNRGGARNLGAKVATTDWILQADLDHVLRDARGLLRLRLDPGCWYRFRRFRIGAADETRRKDRLPDAAGFGAVEPHVDSYLCTRELYWQAGGYDERYSGSLGGSAPFLKRMARLARCQVLDIPLYVHTRHAVPDASITTLSRDRSRYEQLRRELGDQLPPADQQLRFPWVRVC